MLESVNSPEDIKNLNVEQLEKLAADIREFLITSVATTGGHLGSNLGIVELTIALHKYFNSPTDKLVFDVGHQGYVHKILTGRKDKFDTLRQYNGLSGFLKQNESEHDVWEAGHSSTSISGAIGYAIARDMNKTNEEVIAIIGDGSLTNGMALEALNHLSEVQTKVIIILNDNEMSISRNIGFINSILTSLSSNNKYEQLKYKIKSYLEHSKIGHSFSDLISVSKKKLKQELHVDAKSFFNAMDLDYIGVVDGHDFKQLNSAFEKAHAKQKSVLVHVKTTKGKGYKYAEIEKWHGIGPFDVNSGQPLSIANGNSYSQMIAHLVESHMQVDDGIVVITPAMGEGSELGCIVNNYPERFFDVGIAEEHAVTLAAGMGLAHKKPFVSIYSTFFQRSYDQMFHDVVRQNANVVIGLDRAGLVGQDGETHQGIYDLSSLLHMHNVIVCQGRNEQEIKSLMQFCFDYDGPTVIRYPRGGNFKYDTVQQIDTIEVQPGVWNIIRPINKINVLSFGELLNTIEQVIDTNNISNIGVINALFLKPIDEQILASLNNSVLVIAEEHTNIGGFGNYVLNYINQHNLNIKVHLLNLGDHFIEQGNVSELLNDSDISADNILKVLKALENEEN